mmetsp:Transcript_50309/g.120031  ORF Transcript_50309/g.120031 Transcript_50309/m.120031 type:complete len:367 (-) Transcript_50309:45-1145(-)|eukprot:CAMPEP_0181444012 /NCGR_PEP_ID=MMETSP1110-20121109/24847_1 /TAXON_ID=174948 /ORGANISM="Symbiodinium sp., Strain CCMP421" /LENGTH=366 /DNA_ID=CAMNT_0023568001 /DNA_START=63 /DNA_END=1163 /DNA_ORIENTATION=-
MLRLFVVALAICFGTDLEELGVDDECGTTGSCSLTALQLRSRKLRDELYQDVEVSGNRSESKVTFIFTFGAVATSKEPLEDLSQPSRSFTGLRCYTEAIDNSFFPRRTDAGSDLNLLMHPKVATLALHLGKDSEFYPGEGRPELPRHGTEAIRLPDVDLHDMKHYFIRLENLQLDGEDVSHMPLFESAHKFANLAWGAYEKQTHWQTKQILRMEDLILKNLKGWRLVAQEQQDTLQAVDNLWLVQSEKTMNCMLVFEGTHSVQEFEVNLRPKMETYCGFEDVHGGYADKLFWLMKHSMPKLRPKLGKCKSVACTGHSLGGSLCEVFAACANSGRKGNLHFDLQDWTTTDTKLMPIVRQKPLSRDNH